MIRWLVEVPIGLVIGAFLWHLRILQVTTFLSSSGLRRWFVTSRTGGPAQMAREWPQEVQPSISAAPLNPAALISYHPEYHQFDPGMAIESLAACMKLGVGWLRTDVRWNELIPDGTHCDLQALDWYRNFLRASSNRGLRNMVVLTTPPAAVLRQRSQGRLEAWTHFLRVVVGELGILCSGYQLMNEPNGPIYRFLSLHDSATAIAGGASIIHNADPSATVAVNISMDVWGWRQYLTDVLRSSGSAIDLIGLDHYPGTWTIGRKDRWAEVAEIADAIVLAEPDSVWSGRHLAIMETGYSTNTLLRNDCEQSQYFKGIQEVVCRLNSKSPRKLTVCGIYELCDGNSRAWLDPEAHFGIMTSDLKPKPAFSAVAQMVEAL